MAHVGQEFRLGTVGCLSLEQRSRGFGEGAADRLFHRTEDPERYRSQRSRKQDGSP